MRLLNGCDPDHPVEVMGGKTDIVMPRGFVPNIGLIEAFHLGKTSGVPLSGVSHDG